MGNFEELMQNISGSGAAKVAAVIDVSRFGFRPHKFWFSVLFFVFGLLGFVALGNLFEGIRNFRYLIYVAAIVYCVFYQNPRLMNFFPRLSVGVIGAVIFEMSCRIIVGTV